MRVADNPGDPFEGSKVLRRALSEASSDGNARSGIIAANAAYHVTCITIRRRGDGARVQNDKIRLPDLGYSGESASLNDDSIPAPSA